MDREHRVALLKLIKEARDESRMRELFIEFTEFVSSLPPQRRPADEAVRDVLLAFGPSAELAFELSDYYHRRAWGADGFAPQ